MRSLLFHVVILLLLLAAAPSAENWPQWRGPSANGLSGEKNLPVRWSKTENVTWKLELPAWSGSTPIVWGDRIFLNVADGRVGCLRAVGGNRARLLREGEVRITGAIRGEHVRIPREAGRDTELLL